MMDKLYLVARIADTRVALQGVRVLHAVRESLCCACGCVVALRALCPFCPLPFDTCIVPRCDLHWRSRTSVRHLRSFLRLCLQFFKDPNGHRSLKVTAPFGP